MILSAESAIGFAFYQKMGLINNVQSLKISELKNFAILIKNKLNEQGANVTDIFSSKQLNNFLVEFNRYVTYNKEREALELNKRVTRSDLPYIFRLRTYKKKTFGIFTDAEISRQVFLDKINLSITPDKEPLKNPTRFIKG